MCKEKKWIKGCRWFWGGACLICFVVSIIAGVVGGRVVILNDSAYADNISCEIEVEFDKKVNSGYMEVAFYDGAGNLIETQEGYLRTYGKTGSATFYVNNVDSYEILSCYVTVSNMIWRIYAIVFFCTVFFAAWCSAMLLCYKEYEYEGYKIAVYAGYYRHYITVNGKTGDEHNTILSFTPIAMSCPMDDNQTVSAVISLTNRITLKINGVLYRTPKTRRDF